MTNTTTRTAFTALRRHLLAADEALHAIINQQEWLTLGYNHLHEAWKVEMKGVSLTGIHRAKIIRAMFDDQSTFEQVAEAIHGVGYRTAQLHFDAYVQGMGIEETVAYVGQRLAVGSGEGIFVRGHFRTNKYVKRNSLRMEGFRDEELKEWRHIAAQNDMSLAEWAKQMLRDAAILPEKDSLPG